MNKKATTVQDLINILNNIQDKTLPIFCYDDQHGEIFNISTIDTNISDRIDINFSCDSLNRNEIKLSPSKVISLINEINKNNYKENGEDFLSDECEAEAKSFESLIYIINTRYPAQLNAAFSQGFEV